MHVLISNHNAEIAAFRQALGNAAAALDVVENNLSALSLIDGSAVPLQSLVITEHQDEGVNIDTGAFVRRLATHTPDAPTIIVVGPLFSDLRGSSIQLVATIAEAADVVKRIAVTVPHKEAALASAATPATNGHARHVEVVTAQVETRPAPPKRSLGKRAAPEPIKQPTPPAAFAAPAVYEAAPVVVESEAAPAPPTEHEAAPVADSAPMANVAPVVEVEAPMASAAPADTMAAPADAPSVPVVPAPPQTLDDAIKAWNEHAERRRTESEAAPTTLWQRVGKLVGISHGKEKERPEDRLDDLIRTPRLTRCHSIAVISPKGGVGKSFLTYLLGNFLAHVRGDKVIAIDTNPDFGTLADQVRGREQHTVSSLLEHIDEIRHYSDLRRFTSKVESRLEVLAAPADPDVMASITAGDYNKVYQQLHHYYDTVLFDCGTGFRDDITRFALQQCDQVVLVSAPLFITTGIVMRALSYIEQIGCPLDRVTLAVNQVRAGQPLSLQDVREQFGSRLNGIIDVPFDMQLYRDLDRGDFNVLRTQPTTRMCIKQLAAGITQHYS